MSVNKELVEAIEGYILKHWLYKDMDLLEELEEIIHRYKEKK